MKPFLLQELSVDEAKRIRDKLLDFISDSVTAIEVDRRDPWPAKPNEYIKGLTFYYFLL